MIPLRLSVIAALVTVAGAVIAIGAFGLGIVHKDDTGNSRGFPIETIDLPDVMVIDTDGRPRRFLQDIAGGRLLVMNFNFTTCETICPVGNVVMKAVDERAGAEVDAPVRLLSITIDPAQDTPRRMRAAAEEVGASENWLWLTGSPADIDRLLGRFGARAAEIQLHDPIFLIGDARTGRFRRIIGLPEPERLLQMLKEIAS